MSDLPYWLALARISVLGARRIMRLLHLAGSAEKAFTLDADRLIAAGMPPKAAAVFIEERAKIDPEQEWRQCRDLGIEVVRITDDGYPSLLREIYDPPALLFYRGELPQAEDMAVAVVGSRKASAYGMAAAEKISAGLAAAGVVVVSGMARGIDTCAHLGALTGGGRTLAVLGSGLDVCYPPENRKLYARIVQNGAVLSEFPPGTPPKPAHFPLRNRIISGLSRAVVVVEAAAKSGALITADCALEQGREVFAVPGSVNSSMSKGCHRLLKEGAALAEDAGDILQGLGLAPAAAGEEVPAGAEGPEAAVLTALECEPVHFDSLASLTGMSAAELHAFLVRLELEGKIKKLPGNFFLRV